MLEIVVGCLLLAPVSAGELHAEEAVVVSGVVRDQAERPLAGAQVVRVTRDEAAEAHVVLTGLDGRFRMDVPGGRVVLRASRAGHAAATQDLDARENLTDVVFVLAAIPRLDETVVVEAVRAADWVPVTATDLPRERIEGLDHGQEMPFLLKAAPSLTQYSDNGSEGGYSYISLRGIPQSRLNLTLDGVPLADAEDGAFYWVNIPGLAGAVESLQVQRGVGTSSIGTASFGGSVSLEGRHPAEGPGLDAALGMGSLGTGRGSLGAQTGRFGPELAAFARAHYQETDGYRDHSGVLQRSFFFGASRQGERSFLNVFGVAGREQQQLAFLAVDEETLRGSPRENPLSPAERDRFGQQLLQAQLAYALSAQTRLTAQAYTTAADGWYRIYADAERTSLFEYGLDWRTVGGTATLNHRRGALELTLGTQVQGFTSTHSRQVVDVGPDYENHGDKDEWSAFAKAGYRAGRWSAWADAQVRHARFRYEGDLDLGSVGWTFFNPRAGARFEVRPPLSLYLSLGRSMREPARSDLFAGEDNPTLPYDLRAVKPERVTDLEAGVDWRTSRLSLQANLYFMEFRNEIAQTGELSEIGLPLRRNVDRSYRRGFELEAAFQATPGLRFAANANLNRSRIRSWTQFVDVYDESGAFVTSEPRLFDDVPPLATPSFVGNTSVELQRGLLRLSLLGRYVGKAHLDNTGNDTSRTPGFFDADASVRVDLSRLLGRGSAWLRFDVTNLFDHDWRWPNGYSYLFLTRDGAGRDTAGGVNYFYPLAGRTFFLGVELGL
jgi:iron complex outermembrane recepter protein